MKQGARVGDVDDYLAKVPAEARAMLNQLRQMIKAMALNLTRLSATRCQCTNTVDRS